MAWEQQDLIGRSVSHYEIVAQLGSGGMGVVYRAEDARLGRAVALKFLPHELSTNEHALERFRREARAASCLNHPNICVIHDIGEEQGRHYIVMELLEGESLEKHLQSRRPALHEMLEWSAQVADALEAAHEQ